MARRRSGIDWYSVFLSYFDHDGGVGASSSNSPAPAPHQAPATQPRNEIERRFGPGAQQVDDDDGPHFRLNRAPAKKAAVGLGPADVDAPSLSMGVCDFSLVDEDEQEEYVSREHCSMSSPKFSGQKNDGQADVGLGPDIPSASKGVYNNFIPVDDDEQGEHVSSEHCSKLSPKSCGQKNNNGKNKRKSQGNGGKRKPSVNKRRDRATDSEEESDSESSLSSRFSKR